VRAGVIALRVGIPHDEDPWGWSCGFYPGSHLGDLGTARADTTLLGDLRDPVPKATPPSDHIPLRGVVRFGPPLRRSRSSPAMNVVSVKQGKKNSSIG
jgi:hypothetical protein